MEFLDGKAIARLLLEKYSRNPKGWNFTIAPAKKYGFFDAIVSSTNEAWQIKIDSIYKPSPIVLGVSTEVDLSRMNSFSPLSFGYRQLDQKIALELLSGYESGGDTNLMTNFGPMLSSLEPVVPEEGGSYAEGPFVFTNRKTFSFSENQKSLDDRLSAELIKIMRNKYPSYG